MPKLNPAISPNEKSKTEEKKSSSFKIYSDGVSYGRWSMRLTNIPQNLSTISSAMFGAVIGATNFLNQVLADASTSVPNSDVLPAKQNFAIVGDTIENASFYQASSNNSKVIDLFKDTLLETCSNAFFTNHDYSFNQTVREWGDYNTILKRSGAMQSSEECVINLLDDAVSNIKHEQDFDKVLGIFYMATSEVITLGIATCFLCCLINRCRQQRMNQQSSIQSEDSESRALTSENSLQKQYDTFNESIHQIDTLQNRLERIGIDPLDDPIGQYFCCSVTKEIMEDPVVANDGNAYDREALEEHLKYNKYCPKNREVKFRQYFPDLTLKALIIEWVENCEKNFNKLKNNNNNEKNIDTVIEVDNVGTQSHDNLVTDNEGNLLLDTSAIRLSANQNSFINNLSPSRSVTPINDVAKTNTNITIDIPSSLSN